MLLFLLLVRFEIYDICLEWWRSARLVPVDVLFICLEYDLDLFTLVQPTICVWQLANYWIMWLQLGLHVLRRFSFFFSVNSLLLLLPSFTHDIVQLAFVFCVRTANQRWGRVSFYTNIPFIRNEPEAQTIGVIAKTNSLLYNSFERIQRLTWIFHLQAKSLSDHSVSSFLKIAQTQHAHFEMMSFCPLWPLHIIHQALILSMRFLPVFCFIFCDYYLLSFFVFLCFCLHRFPSNSIQWCLFALPVCVCVFVSIMHWKEAGKEKERKSKSKNSVKKMNFRNNELSSMAFRCERQSISRVGDQSVKKIQF